MQDADAAERRRLFLKQQLRGSILEPDAVRFPDVAPRTGAGTAVGSDGVRSRPGSAKLSPESVAERLRAAQQSQPQPLRDRASPRFNSSADHRSWSQGRGGAHADGGREPVWQGLDAENMPPAYDAPTSVQFTDATILSMSEPRPKNLFVPVRAAPLTPEQKDWTDIGVRLRSKLRNPIAADSTGSLGMDVGLDQPSFNNTRGLQVCSSSDAAHPFDYVTKATQLQRHSDCRRSMRGLRDATSSLLNRFTIETRLRVKQQAVSAQGAPLWTMRPCTRSRLQLYIALCQTSPPGCPQFIVRGCR